MMKMNLLSTLFFGAVGQIYHMEKYPVELIDTTSIQSLQAFKIFAQEDIYYKPQQDSEWQKRAYVEVEVKLDGPFAPETGKRLSEKEQEEIKKAYYDERDRKRREKERNGGDDDVDGDKDDLPKKEAESSTKSKKKGLRQLKASGEEEELEDNEVEVDDSMIKDPDQKLQDAVEQTTKKFEETKKALADKKTALNYDAKVKEFDQKVQDLDNKLKEKKFTGKEWTDREKTAKQKEKDEKKQLDTDKANVEKEKKEFEKQIAEVKKAELDAQAAKGTAVFELKEAEYKRNVGISIVVMNRKNADKMLDFNREDSRSFCGPGKSFKSSADDVEPLINMKVLDGKWTKKRFEILESGSYIILVVDCREFHERVSQGKNVNYHIDGRIVIRNPFGFVPAVYYHKKPFYGLLGLMYIALLIVWCLVCLRWKSELFRIHHCITVVAFISAFEGLSWWMCLNAWNVLGPRPEFLFAMSHISTVMKNCFAMMLVLAACMGWGVTRPHLDQSCRRALQSVTVSYLMIMLIRDLFMAFRETKVLNTRLMAGSYALGMYINGYVFLIIFHFMGKLAEVLEERNDQEKIQLFDKLWKVIFGAMLVGIGSFGYQSWSMAMGAENAWMTEWFFTDAVQHLCFLAVTAAMMYLWAPHHNGLKYSWAYQLGEDGQLIQPEIAGLDDSDEEFWSGLQKASETEMTNVDEEAGNAAQESSSSDDEVVVKAKKKSSKKKSDKIIHSLE